MDRFKHPPCKDPVWSPTTDDALKRDTIAVVEKLNIVGVLSGTADRVETQVRRLKSKIPAQGEVRGLMISDAQWGRMIIMRSQQTTEAEKMPAQMQFF